MLSRPTITAGLVAVVAGCRGEPLPGGFDAADADARVDAILATSAEQPAYPRLIEQLESEDPLARLTAIESLERRTGRAFGYRPYDAESDRRVAVARWVEWYRQGAIVP